MIKTAAISLSDFSPDNAIRLWWDEKTRRPMRRDKPERSDESHQTNPPCVEDDKDPKTMLRIGISGSQTAMKINLLAFVQCIRTTFANMQIPVLICIMLIVLYHNQYTNKSQLNAT